MAKASDLDEHVDTADSDILKAFKENPLPLLLTLIGAVFGAVAVLGLI